MSYNNYYPYYFKNKRHSISTKYYIDYIEYIEYENNKLKVENDKLKEDNNNLKAENDKKEDIINKIKKELE